MQAFVENKQINKFIKRKTTIYVVYCTISYKSSIIQLIHQLYPTHFQHADSSPPELTSTPHSAITRRRITANPVPHGRFLAFFTGSVNHPDG